MPYYPPTDTTAAGAIDVQDEGSSQGTATSFNFTGAGVSASVAGQAATINVPGGAGTGAQGTATIDFGAAPGTGTASVVVVGQASIGSSSTVSAWMDAGSTADHNAEEHKLVDVKVSVGDIIVGTGFTIYAYSPSGLRLTGMFNVRWSWV